MKIERRPGTDLVPSPVVLVTAGEGEAANIITIGWVGMVNSAPPMIGIAVRTSRHSYPLLCAAREFVVNIPRAAAVAQVDVAGVLSGDELNKFDEIGFTAVPASQVGAPLIAECPINLECVVRHQLALGTHELFIGEIVASHFDEEVLDGRGNFLPSAEVGPRAARLRVLVAGPEAGRLRRLRQGLAGAQGRRRVQELTTRQPMRFFITTPIYYVNADPHLGHAYTTIAADILARFHRQCGDEVFFLTGTDEHGNKVAQAAAELGRTPKEHCDIVAERFRALTGQLNASNDFFIRTTDAQHESFVQQFVAAAQGGRRHREAHLRRPLLHRLRRLLLRARSGGRPVPHPPDRARLAGRGELLLPAQPVSGPAGRVLPRPPRLGEAQVALQRGPLVHRAGAGGHLHQPLVDHLGHPGAVGPRPGHLRLGRRAHQLPLGAHLRAPR